MKKRTMAIARGDIKPSRDDPKIWFTWPESFAKVLSNRNRALLNLIAATHPDSLQTLATRTGRKASNLSRTLRTMERYGFVRLHKGARGRPGHRRNLGRESHPSFRLAMGRAKRQAGAVAWGDGFPYGPRFPEFSQGRIPALSAAVASVLCPRKER
jgi:hypothetical protein